MNPTNGQPTFTARLERIEYLLDSIRQAPNPVLRNSAEELVQTLLELHGAGIERMLECIWDEGDAGQRIIHESLVDDDLVSSLLLLHGLHPLSVEARVEQSLDKVRPYLESHGGGVEVVGVRDGVVRLRLKGSCDGCPASAMTLKLAVEEAILKKVPDVHALETVEDEAGAPAGAGEQPGPCLDEQPLADQTALQQAI